MYVFVCDIHYVHMYVHMKVSAHVCRIICMCVHLHMLRGLEFMFSVLVALPYVLRQGLSLNTEL